MWHLKTIVMPIIIEALGTIEKVQARTLTTCLAVSAYNRLKTLFDVKEECIINVKKSKDCIG